MDGNGDNPEHNAEHAQRPSEHDKRQSQKAYGDLQRIMGSGKSGNARERDDDNDWCRHEPCQYCSFLWRRSEF